MDKDVLLVLIGGIIGFLSSIGIIIVERVLDRKGKLKIYYKFISDRSNGKPWGIHNNSDSYDELLLAVPTILEIQNTSNSAKVVRDLNIEMYYNNKYVDKLVQASDTEKKENGKLIETYQYGTENNSYSFFIEPKSIHKFKCYFIYIIKVSEKKNKQFDSLHISYYNERDKKKTCVTKTNLKGWDMTDTKPDRDWILLK